MVLNGGGNEVILAFTPCPRDTFDCPVIAFGATAGEEHFIGIGVDQFGNLLAGALYRLSRLLPHRVNSRGVPISAVKER
jgi:hypothetical protein